jgi:hypothetical protein
MTNADFLSGEVEGLISGAMEQAWIFQNIYADIQRLGRVEEGQGNYAEPRKEPFAGRTVDEILECMAKEGTISERLGDGL